MNISSSPHSISIVFFLSHAEAASPRGGGGATYAGEIKSEMVKEPDAVGEVDAAVLLETERRHWFVNRDPWQLGEVAHDMGKENNLLPFSPLNIFCASIANRTGTSGGTIQQCLSLLLSISSPYVFAG